MKKKSASKKSTGLFLSLGLIAASVIYVFSQYTSSAQVAINTVPTISHVQAQVTTTVATKSPSPAKSSGAYTNGSYTGTATDAYYGTVQVQATIQNGQIADVKFLQYPSDRSTSRSINSRAMPVLASEAVTAQSSQVNAVSGATFTSEAFIQSLHSALTQAQA